MNMIHIVIPVYNVEKYLEGAVRSVLDQPYKGIDIVLVDDGSPDNSPAICDRLAKECDRVAVIHQENKGLPGARNTGMEYFLEKYSDGYIGFLDSDDMWVPNTVDEEFVEKYIEPGWDIIEFQYYEANEQMTWIRPFPSKKRGLIDDPRTISMWDASVIVWNKLYKIPLIKDNKIAYFEELRFGEDTAFNSIVRYYAESLMISDKSLVYYRANPKSISNVFGKTRIEPWLYVINGLLRGIKEYEIADEKYVSMVYDYCSWLFLELSELYYLSFGVGNKPYEILENHELGEYFKNGEHSSLSLKEKERIRLMLGNRRRFKLKFYLKGIPFGIKNKLKCCKPIVKLCEKHIYTQKIGEAER